MSCVECIREHLAYAKCHPWEGRSEAVHKQGENVK